jgi:copper chaperone
MQTTIKVNGMSCDHCKSSVEGALRCLPGVTAAAVDLKAGEARVTYDEGRVDEARLRRAIEDVGFDPE